LVASIAAIVDDLRERGNQFRRQPNMTDSAHGTDPVAGEVGRVAGSCRPDDDALHR
jgi:hypothetical protein